MVQGKKIGLALSGGGARGIAHIGAIHALETHGIYPDALSGTSAGSLIGALYASGKSPAEMMEFVKDSSFWKIFQIGLPLDGFARLTYLQERLQEVIQIDDFAALKKSLYVAVSNLNQGKLEIRHSGTLFQAILASCAIPLIFKPIEIDGHIYVDGGLLNNLPSQPLRETCDLVIGINVMPNGEEPSKAFQTALGIALRSFELSIYANTIPSKALCDIVIEPEALRRFHIFQFNKYKDIYQIGYETTLAQIPDILTLIDK